MELEMVPYKDQGIFKLKTVDDITQALEEHQVQLSAMKSTRLTILIEFQLSEAYESVQFTELIFTFTNCRFVEPFAAEVDYWERALSNVNEVLEAVLIVQRSYMYLDNIFYSEDIRRQLPKETDDYARITLEWMTVSGRMAAHGLALPATNDPRECKSK